MAPIWLIDLNIWFKRMILTFRESIVMTEYIHMGMKITFTIM